MRTPNILVVMLLINFSHNKIVCSGQSLMCMNSSPWRNCIVAIIISLRARTHLHMHMQLKEYCITALGYLSVGEASFPLRETVLEALYALREEKAVELQFTVGEALACTLAGRICAAAHDPWKPHPQGSGRYGPSMCENMWSSARATLCTYMCVYVYTCMYIHLYGPSMCEKMWSSARAILCMCVYGSWKTRYFP